MIQPQAVNIKKHAISVRPRRQVRRKVRSPAVTQRAYTDYDRTEYSGVAPGWYEKENGDWYFFDSKLHMLTDWQYIDGSWYHFEADGRMDADTIADGWYLDENGRRQDELPYGYELISEQEKASMEASAAEEESLRTAESESAAEESRRAEITRAAEADKARLKEVTDRYSGHEISDKPDDGTRIVLKTEADISGADVSNAVSETDSLYIINGAGITESTVLSNDTVNRLNTKDRLDISVNGRDYHLMVMSTGTDADGHKSISFKDELIR